MPEKRINIEGVGEVHLIKKKNVKYLRLSVKYPDVIRVSIPYFSSFRQVLFHTEKGFCYTCNNFHECSICMPYIARASKNLKKIPPWVCELKNIQISTKKKIKNSILKGG